MNNKWVLGLGFVCVATTVASVILWMELNAQRELVQAESAARAQAEARYADLQAQLDSMRNGFRGTRPTASSATTEEGGPSSVELGSRNEDGVRLQSPQAGQPKSGPSGMRGVNRNLIATLQLNDAQTEQLAKIMNERQARMRQLAEQSNGRPDRNAADALADETDRRVQELLGDSKYQEYEDYFRDIEEHMQVSQLDRRLSDLGQGALSPTQQTQLFNVLREERDLIPAPVRDTYPARDQYRAAYNAWRSGYEQRVQNRASSILSADQFATFTTPPRRERR